jgi:hypothetical protein
LERICGGRVTTFEGFEDGHGGRKRGVGDSLMQGKFSRGDILPKAEREAQNCERGEDRI